MAKKEKKDNVELTETGLPKVKPNRIIQKSLKVEFTPEEIKEFGSSLATCVLKMDELKDKKKAKAKEFKDVIDEKEAEIESLSNKINNGYEYTNIDCEVFLNVPNSGRKQIVRMDTKEVVEELDMTQEELQVRMDFEKAE